MINSYFCETAGIFGIYWLKALEQSTLVKLDILISTQIKNLLWIRCIILETQITLHLFKKQKLGLILISIT